MVYLKSIRHPDEMALYSRVITFDGLDEMNENRHDILEFMGLYADDNGNRYSLFVFHGTHEWYAVAC